MRKIPSATVCLCSVFFLFTSCASKPPGPSHTMVWCGLDYSKVKMIGKDDFRQPDRIFPAMLLEWNRMFMEEAFNYLHDMEKDVRVDLRAVEANNGKAGPEQVQRADGTEDEMVKSSHITEADIAEMVKGYNLESTQGIGLVFIMDRLVKKQEQVCAYVVFFDVATRKVLRSDRQYGTASKGSFRTHWFKPLKGMAHDSPGTYRRMKEQGVI